MVQSSSKGSSTPNEAYCWWDVGGPLGSSSLVPGLLEARVGNQLCCEGPSCSRLRTKRRARGSGGAPACCGPGNADSAARGTGPRPTLGAARTPEPAPGCSKQEKRQ